MQALILTIFAESGGNQGRIQKGSAAHGAAALDVSLVHGSSQGSKNGVRVEMMEQGGSSFINPLYDKAREVKPTTLVEVTE